MKIVSCSCRQQGIDKRLAYLPINRMWCEMFLNLLQDIVRADPACKRAGLHAPRPQHALVALSDARLKQGQQHRPFFCRRIHPIDPAHLPRTFEYPPDASAGWGTMLRVLPRLQLELLSGGPAWPVFMYKESTQYAEVSLPLACAKAACWEATVTTRLLVELSNFLRVQGALRGHLKGWDTDSCLHCFILTACDHGLLSRTFRIQCHNQLMRHLLFGQRTMSTAHVVF